MDFQDALNNLYMAIVADFAERYADADDQDRVDFFAGNLEFVEGRKYIKVTKKICENQTLVWGFIVKEDDKKFKAGDILKAASWAAPARNKARGNIFEDYSIAWTGPNYLS